MAKKKNSPTTEPRVARNRPKAAKPAQSASTKTPKTPRKPSRFRNFTESSRRKWADPRIQNVAGVGALTLSLFIVGALVSGLLTGAQDYTFVSEGLLEAVDKKNTPYNNWLGGTGAYLAFWMGRQGLGMGALAIPFWIWLLSWPWITKEEITRSGSAFRLSILGMIVLPWSVGFVAQLSGNLGSAAWDHWIGASGYYLVELGLLLLGTWGSGLVLLGIIMSLLVFYAPSQFFNWKLPRLGSLRSWFAYPEGDHDTEFEAPLASKKTESTRSVETPFEPTESEELPTQPNESDEPWIDDASENALDALLDDIETEEQQGVANKLPNEEKAERTEEISPSVKEEEKQSDDVAFEVHLASDEEQLSESEIDQKVQAFGEYDPKLDLSRFELPNLDLLVQHGDGKVRVSEEELEENKTRIINTLRNFSIEVSSIKAEVGPTVTLYEIVPAPGIRISKIKNLEDDIALSLAALGIRIIAPIPGRGTIGIEVPNSNPDIVSMRSLIASEKFQQSKAALPIAMGKTISNETYVFDLAKMPHLLMAGATGQGKSVGLNAMLVSLLYRKHPSQLKFVLVDPKKVELTLFNHIERHYLAKLPDSEEAIITDTSKVVATLNSLCVEMDQRYDLLKDAQCRNLAEYNAKFIRRKLNPEEGHKYLPYIVLVVDEFADLIMTAGKEVETPIARLAQLARAIGIHLIIATQRPSVNIITGTIKANFPARIAFRVTSKIDSRTILDAGGADQLIGRGDMLMSTGNDLIRIQCGFVDTPEVEAICEFVGSQQGYPEAFLLPEYTPEGGASESGHLADDERDVMFEDAARMIVLHQQGSTSLLQRKLKLGYNRAGRIIDQLETAGIIGPFEGSKARKVLIPDEASLEQMLQKGNT